MKSGSTAVVVGDGAVGLLGVLSAKQMGAERIIPMSRHAPRHRLAREFGATDIVTERGEERVGRIKELTHGIGADSVLGATTSRVYPRFGDFYHQTFLVFRTIIGIASVRIGVRLIMRSISGLAIHLVQQPFAALKPPKVFAEKIDDFVPMVGTHA